MAIIKKVYIMKHNYFFEKLLLTVDDLATSNKKMKDRLFNAVISHFIRIEPGSINDIPAKYYDKYKDIMTKLTIKEPINNQGRIFATIYSMKRNEPKKIAKEIFDLFYCYIKDNLK